MIKKRKGFSLAEVLVTLMIVGVVAAATVPTVTKRSMGHDKLWDWADYPLGSAYFTGAHVLLDSASNARSLPKMSVSPDYFSDNYFPEAKKELTASAKLLSENVFMPSLDKIAVFNNYNEDKNINNIQRSHISFYNEITGSNSTSEVYEYGGRLAADRTNLALGIGGLQYLEPNNIREGMYNTSIGHYNMFVAKKASNNTALGRYALVEFDEVDSTPRTFNVAIGNKAQVYNMHGRNNTAVGYRALNGIEGDEDLLSGNFNIALGVEALGATGAYGNIVNVDERRYISRNIGLGYRAGYNKGSIAEDSKLDSGKTYRLFIGNEQIQPLQSRIWHSGTNKINGVSDVILDSEFNINADELIVNTADGKHTILKIRMIDDAGVNLPTFKGDDSTYNNINYCAGEGSDDLEKISKNRNLKEATADVCIAKFKDVARVIPSYEGYEGIKFSNEKKQFADWDIFMKSIDVGFDSGVMTGSNTRAHIQTVKAALNYIDAHKEGQGLLSSAIDAFVQNLRCFFTYFAGAGTCNHMDSGYQRNFVAEVKAWLNSVVDRVEDAVCGFSIMEAICRIASDNRLKDVSGVSTAGLKEINALKIKNYTYKADKNKTPHVGVIAQELQKVFPNSVFEGSDGYLRIKQEEMFFAMVNAIKELDKQDKELKNKILKANKQIKDAVQKNKALVDKNEQLKAENEKLNAQLKLLEANQ